MNLGELRIKVLEGMGKNQYGGFCPPGAGVPNSFPDTINNAIQDDIMNDCVKKFEETRILSIDIRPFIKTLGDPTNPQLTLVPWSAASSFSYGQFPSDFWYFSDAQSNDFVNQCHAFTKRYRSINWVSRARWNYITSSSRLFPSVTNPAASIQNDQIIVCPALTKLTFTYLRLPANVVFDYEILTGNTVSYLPPGSVHTNATTAPIGTPSTSVELEWPQSMEDEFLSRLIQWYGRTIQSPVDMQMPSKKP